MASIVMTSAARNLTPVTLELGGKCPAIFDHLSNPSDFKVTHMEVLRSQRRNFCRVQTQLWFYRL